MDQTIMIAVIMILCIAVTVAALAMVARKQTHKQRRTLEVELSRLTVNGHLNISRKEVFRNRIIALDTGKSVLVYIRLDEGAAISDVIDLDQVQKCEAINMGTKTKETAKKDTKTQQEHVNEIHLVLHVTNGITFRIVMYSEIEDGALEMAELRNKALEWRDIISGNRQAHKAIV